MQLSSVAQNWLINGVSAGFARDLQTENLSHIPKQHMEAMQLVQKCLTSQLYTTGFLQSRIKYGPK